MSFVDDRWIRKVRHPDDSVTAERTERYGKGLRYRARYTDPDGTEHSRSFADGRKREAVSWVQQQAADVARGTWTDLQAGKMTLRRFAEDVYLPSLTFNITTRERIASTLELHVHPTLGGKPLGYLAGHPSVIQAWVQGLPMAPSSAKVVLSVLSGVLTAACNDGLIGRHPVHGGKVRPPRTPRQLVVPWTSAEVASARADLPARYRATADAGSGLGLRLSEMFGLSPDDIDWLRGSVHVRRQVKIAGGRQCFAPPKGGKDRHVPLPDSVKLALAAHLAAFPAAAVTLPQGEPGGKPATVRLIFTTQRGRALRRGDYAPAWARAAAGRAGGGGFHSLRHHFASVLLAAGVDIRKLAAYLGHNDPAFTLRTYAHLMSDGGDSMRQAIDRARDGVDGPTTDQAAVGESP
jgi:integrase